MGKSTISIAIFHCYVSSPEGKQNTNTTFSAASNNYFSKAPTVASCSFASDGMAHAQLWSVVPSHREVVKASLSWETKCRTSTQFSVSNFVDITCCEKIHIDRIRCTCMKIDVKAGLARFDFHQGGSPCWHRVCKSWQPWCAIHVDLLISVDPEPKSGAPILALWMVIPPNTVSPGGAVLSPSLAWGGSAVASWYSRLRFGESGQTQWIRIIFTVP